MLTCFYLGFAVDVYVFNRVFTYCFTAAFVLTRLVSYFEMLSSIMFTVLTFHTFHTFV